MDINRVLRVHVNVRPPAGDAAQPCDVPPQSADKLPVRSGCRILTKPEAKLGEVRMAFLLTLPEKINALQAESFSLFVAGWGEGEEGMGGGGFTAHSVNR